ncbi:MAG TPA: hypothetical protein VMT03_11605 [Polyangia bacterium]|nr:hypothetical protein [Polyangia bacterium]
MATVAGAATFAPVCGRVPARRLAAICLFASALGLVVLRGAPDAEGAALAAIVFAQAFGAGLATTAIAGLALAATPRGVEALGVLLITDLPWILRDAILQPFLSAEHLPFSILVDAAAAAFLLAVAALRLPQTE